MPALADRKVKHYCGLYRRKLTKYEEMMRKLREIAGCDVELKENKRPHWMDEIVKPLAAALGKVRGKPVVVSGPFGICCNVSLSVEGGRCNSLEFRPYTDGTRGTELYMVDCSSDTGKFREGSLGSINGMNKQSYLADAATLQELADAMRSVRGLQRLIKKLQQLEASARKRL